MRVLLDTNLCQGHGQCVLFASEVFALDDDTGIAILLNESPDESLRPNVVDAVRACPVRAIKIET
jgi:ferredoxin